MSVFSRSHFQVTKPTASKLCFEMPYSQRIMEKISPGYQNHH